MSSQCGSSVCKVVNYMNQIPVWYLKKCDTVNTFCRPMSRSPSCYYVHGSLAAHHLRHVFILLGKGGNDNFLKFVVGFGVSGLVVKLQSFCWCCRSLINKVLTQAHSCSSPRPPLLSYDSYTK